MGSRERGPFRLLEPVQSLINWKQRRPPDEHKDPRSDLAIVGGHIFKLAMMRGHLTR